MVSPPPDLNFSRPPRRSSLQVRLGSKRGDFGGEWSQNSDSDEDELAITFERKVTAKESEQLVENGLITTQLTTDELVFMPNECYLIAQITDSSLKDALQQCGGIEKIDEENGWFEVCKCLNLPSNNYNIIEYIKQLCLINFNPKIFEILPHKVIRSKKLPEKSLASLENVEFSKDSSNSALNKILKSLDSGKENEIDFALNTLYFCSKLQKASKTILTAPGVLDLLFAFCGIAYNSNQNLNSLKEQFKHTQSFWKRYIDDTFFDQYVSNYKSHDDSFSSNSDSDKFFIRFSVSLSHSVQDRKIINRIATILATLKNLLMHAESSLAKKISNLQEIQIITIACQKSNIALLIDLSNDLLLELSKHLSLLVSKDSDESIEDSLNSSADIYRMNLENCVVQIIFAKLKSKNSRQNMLALIALTNMISFQETWHTNSKIIDNYFAENPKYIDILIDCLAETCDRSEDPFSSTFEAMRFQATEFLFNLSFFKVHLLSSAEFAIIETLMNTVNFLIQSSAFQSAKKNHPVPKSDSNLTKNISNQKPPPSCQNANPQTAKKTRNSQKLLEMQNISNYHRIAHQMHSSIESNKIPKINHLSQRHPSKPKPKAETGPNSQNKPPQSSSDTNYLVQGGLLEYFVAHITIILRNLVRTCGMSPKLYSMIQEHLQVVTCFIKLFSGLDILAAKLIHACSNWQSDSKVFNYVQNKSKEKDRNPKRVHYSLG